MSIAFTVPAERANRAHYETHAVSVPARSFTGDFYSAMSARDGGLVFALGDVAGKVLPQRRLFELWPSSIRKIADAALAATALAMGCSIARFDSRFVRRLRSLGIAVWSPE